MQEQASKEEGIRSSIKAEAAFKKSPNWWNAAAFEAEKTWRLKVNAKSRRAFRLGRRTRSRLIWFVAVKALLDKQAEAAREDQAFGCWSESPALRWILQAKERLQQEVLQAKQRQNQLEVSNCRVDGFSTSISYDFRYFDFGFRIPHCCSCRQKFLIWRGSWMPRCLGLWFSSSFVAGWPGSKKLPFRSKAGWPPMAFEDASQQELRSQFRDVSIISSQTDEAWWHN